MGKKVKPPETLPPPSGSLGGRGKRGGYEQLARDSSRDADSLSKWHKLYKRFPDIEEFKEKYAIPQAQKAAEAWLKRRFEPEPRQIGFEQPLDKRRSGESRKPIGG